MAGDAGSSRPHVVVLGAGVIGLTSAHVLKRRGYRVTVAARDMPEDATSTAFASPWAGANWCSFASQSNYEQQRYDQVTFETWTELARHLPSDVIASMPFSQDGLTDVPWFKHVTPDFRLETAEPAASRKLKFSYTSHCINVPRYTQWLVSELHSAGASIVPSSPFLDDAEAQIPACSSGDGAASSSRLVQPVSFKRVGELKSLAEVSSLFPDVALIINATGLGAAKLADVADDTVYPIAGQVVVVESERFKSCPRCVMGILDESRNAGSSAAKERGPSPVSYVIPRARSGHVILGGSYEEGCYDTIVNQELSEKIMRNAVKICPELLLRPPEEYTIAHGSDAQPMSEEKRKEQEAKEIAEILADEDAWKRLRVVSAHVGLRPARRNGIRVAGEELAAGPEKRVKVVHAYGIGPAGYQASWGVAHEVALQVKKTLAEAASPVSTGLERAVEGISLHPANESSHIDHQDDAVTQSSSAGEDSDSASTLVSTPSLTEKGTSGYQPKLEDALKNEVRLGIAAQRVL